VVAWLLPKLWRLLRGSLRALVEVWRRVAGTNPA
jgi:hypothetical protein